VIDWLKRAEITKPVEPRIELDGADLPIILRRHSTAKRLTLRLAPDGGEVRITLPKWANAKDAIAFAHARKDWLAKQLAKLPQRETPQPGGTLLYRGEEMAIEWSQGAARRAKLSGDQVIIGGPQEGLTKRLQRWLEREALQLFEADMTDYTDAAGLARVPVSLSRAQRRWGSCSDKDRIRINWRLVQAPDFVRRSVVAHEVTHLVHFDHSPAFHALLGDIYEGEIIRADKWLKDNGRSLYSSFG